MIDQKVIPLMPFEWEWKPLFELYYRLHVLDAGWTYAKRIWAAIVFFFLRKMVCTKLVNRTAWQTE